MTSAQICIMIAIIVYLIGMIYIGFRCSKKNNSTDDFYLGGRKLGPFVTAMSAEASDMSSWLLMGLPGVAYLTGISDAGWTAIGLAAGTYINWLIVAKRIRRYTHTCNNSITIPSFFSKPSVSIERLNDTLRCRNAAPAKRISVTNTRNFAPPENDAPLIIR